MPSETIPSNSGLGAEAFTSPAAVSATLGRWSETSGGVATLINLSENHTFRIDTPDGRRFALRLHRPGYQSATSIDSELNWLTALRRDTGIPLPRPIPGRDGLLVQHLAGTGPTPSHAVLFDWETGREPQPSDALADLFETLGRYAAVLHEHAAHFALPAGFERPVWSGGAVLDPRGLWGNWRSAPHVEGAVAVVLAQLDQRLRQDLAGYGTTGDRFGLIHADMRLANVLVAADRVTLIDFDDCGFCWFMYDFAAAISFYEADPRVPAWRSRWLKGYVAIRPLSGSDLAIVDAMILLRRMALLAWIGSHHETALAQRHAADFARITAELAVPFLALPLGKVARQV